MMVEDGTVLLSMRRNQANGQLECANYGWEGGNTIRAGLFVDSMIVWAPKYSLWWWMGATHKIGPYPLRFVGFDEDGMGKIYTRVRGLFWWVPVVVYRMTRKLDLFYRRVIITLAVWNLADCSQHTLPSWRDIRLVKRWKNNGK